MKKLNPQKNISRVLTVLTVYILTLLFLQTAGAQGVDDCFSESAETERIPRLNDKCENWILQFEKRNPDIQEKYELDYLYTEITELKVAVRNPLIIEVLKKHSAGSVEELSTTEVQTTVAASEEKKFTNKPDPFLKTSDLTTSHAAIESGDRIATDDLRGEIKQNVSWKWPTALLGAAGLVWFSQNKKIVITR